eukprot:UN01302
MFTIIFVGEMLVKMVSDGVHRWPWFASRSWSLLLAADDPSTMDDENELKELDRWEALCELNLMDLQYQNPEWVQRIEGAVMKSSSYNR